MHLLSLVFTNYPDLVGTVEVMEGFDGSDHNSVTFTLSLPAYRAIGSGFCMLAVTGLHFNNCVCT